MSPPQLPATCCQRGNHHRRRRHHSLSRLRQREEGMDGGWWRLPWKLWVCCRLDIICCCAVRSGHMNIWALWTRADEWHTHCSPDLLRHHLWWKHREVTEGGEGGREGRGGWMDGGTDGWRKGGVTNRDWQTSILSRVGSVWLSV